MHRHLLLFCMLFLALLLQSSAWGQRRYGEFYLAGNVLFDDGRPPKGAVRIELSCLGDLQSVGYSDPQGAFKFRVGDRTARADTTTPTVDLTGGTKRARRPYFDLSGCELTASLSGYRSSVIRLGRRNVSDASGVGTIILRPEAGDVAAGSGSGLAVHEEKDLVTLNTLAAPKAAEKALEVAREYLAAQRPDPSAAIRELEKALEVYPEFAVAWNLLGECRIRLGDEKAGRQAFEKACDAEPSYIAPLLSLSLLSLKENDPASAVLRSSRVLGIDPRNAEALFYKGVACAALDDFAGAEESLRILMDSPEGGRFPRAHYVLGSVLARQGDIEGALEQYELYLKLEPDSQAAKQIRLQQSALQSQRTKP